MAVLHVERYECQHGPWEFAWVGDTFTIYAKHKGHGNYTEINLTKAEAEQLKVSLTTTQEASQ